MSVLPPSDQKATYVHAMFTSIAQRYDLMNRIMTFGLDQGWRRFAVRAIMRPGITHALDVGTGTGDFLPLLERMLPGVLAVGADFTHAMLVAGQAKIATQTKRAAFVDGDALHLPFPDASFDALTTGFALRNVIDIEAALREMARVTRPGGKMACLEVARPSSPVVRFGHQVYFNRIVPLLGHLIGGSAHAYTYLPQSASRFPPPPVLAQIMQHTGWRNVSWHLLGFGAVAVHVGMRN